ncbi:MAG TPA: VOC family protein [Candidatus Thermoplasmatota archaeon]|jgi:hypothetical protein|nr:VOC family protein [Candidatus Thermoplasmatota archaeon]
MANKRRTPTRKTSRKPARTTRATTRATTRRPTARRTAVTEEMPRSIPGAIQHVEFYSEEPAATKRFYSDVFAWTFETASYAPGMQYTGFKTPARPFGGLMDRANVPRDFPSVLTYITVKDVDATARKIERAGGKVLMPKFEVPSVGWFAVFMAPGGVTQAIWQENPNFRPPTQ